jgi:hypothetical protein
LTAGDVVGAIIGMFLLLGFLFVMYRAYKRLEDEDSPNSGSDYVQMTDTTTVETSESPVSAKQAQLDTQLLDLSQQVEQL